jgi:hypothetical protein
MRYPDNYQELEQKWCKYYLGHDVALSEQRGSDYFAMVALKRVLNAPLRVVRKMRAKGSEEEQFEIIRQWNADYHFSKYVIEQKGLSYAMAEKAAKDFTLAASIEKFNTTHASKDHIIGDLRLGMENKLIGLDGDQDIALELGSFGLVTVNGLQTFKALTGHDDLVVALALAFYAAGGWLPKKKATGSFYAIAVGSEPPRGVPQKGITGMRKCLCESTDLRIVGESESNGIKEIQLRCNECGRMWIE